MQVLLDGVDLVPDLQRQLALLAPQRLQLLVPLLPVPQQVGDGGVSLQQQGLVPTRFLFVHVLPFQQLGLVLHRLDNLNNWSLRHGERVLVEGLGQQVLLLLLIRTAGQVRAVRQGLVRAGQGLVLAAVHVLKLVLQFLDYPDLVPDYLF